MQLEHGNRGTRREDLGLDATRDVVADELEPNHATVEYTKSGPVPAPGGSFAQEAKPSASETAFAHPGRGEAGMITQPTVVTIDGKAETLPRGTYVEVDNVKNGSATCRVYSGHKGQAAAIPVAMLQQQPALSEHYRDEMDRGGYMDYKGVLWKKGGPSQLDIDQGRLNDCSIMSAASAVVRSDRRRKNHEHATGENLGPQVIRHLFEPSDQVRAETYQVKLYQRDGERGELKPVVQTVDRAMPSKGDLKDGEGRPIYAGRNHDKNKLDTEDQNVAIWPLLLEKAFAGLAKNGYESLDEGDKAAAAMEALTGHDAAMGTLKGDDGNAIEAKFRSVDLRTHAISCNTRSDKQSSVDRLKLGFDRWHFYDFVGFKGDMLWFRDPHGDDREPRLLHPKDFNKVFATVQITSVTGGFEAPSATGSENGGARGNSEGDGGGGTLFRAGARGNSEGDGGGGDGFFWGGSRGNSEGDGGGGG